MSFSELKDIMIYDYCVSDELTDLEIVEIAQEYGFFEIEDDWWRTDLHAGYAHLEAEAG